MTSNAIQVVKWNAKKYSIKAKDSRKGENGQKSDENDKKVIARW